MKKLKGIYYVGMLFLFLWDIYYFYHMPPYQITVFWYIKVVVTIFICLYISLILHETAHAAGYKKKGIQVEEMCIPMGIFSFPKQGRKVSFTPSFNLSNGYVTPYIEKITKEQEYHKYINGIRFSLLAAPLFSLGIGIIGVMLFIFMKDSRLFWLFFSNFNIGICLNTLQCKEENYGDIYLYLLSKKNTNVLTAYLILALQDNFIEEKEEYQNHYLVKQFQNNLHQTTEKAGYLERSALSVINQMK